IEDGFSISISNYREIINPATAEIIPAGSDYIENFEEIFQAIKEYIRKHSIDFSLGEFVYDKIHSDDLEGKRKRVWWSPFILPSTCRVASELSGIYKPDENRIGKKVFAAKCRKIQHTSGNFIHPAALKREQYEELKKLLPDATTCKVEDCYNDFGFGHGYDGPPGVSGHEVSSGVCAFHRKYRNYQ